MTEIIPAVLDTAKTYKSLFDEIPPKTVRELAEVSRGLIKTWEEKEGVVVDDKVIFGILNGLALVNVLNDAPTASDPFSEVLALIGKLQNKPGNFGVVIAAAIAYEYVSSVAPEALES